MISYCLQKCQNKLTQRGSVTSTLQRAWLRPSVLLGVAQCRRIWRQKISSATLNTYRQIVRSCTGRFHAPWPIPCPHETGRSYICELYKVDARDWVPLDKNGVCDCVKRILDIGGRATPFTNNLPGKDWYHAFRRRNPSVTVRVPQSLGHERAAITEGMIHNWYHKLMEFLQKEVPDWEAMIKDPRRIFNADESGFPLCVKSDKVLAPVGSKHIY